MDRAIARRSGTLHRAIALCCALAALPVAGCRDTNSPDESAAPIAFALVAGDRLIYDAWLTNYWGYTLDSTRTQRTWSVLSTGATGGGYYDAIMVREEILRVGTVTTSADTFLLRVTPEGYVLRFGFLADLVRRRQGREIPQRWDTLAVPDAQSWRVGAIDSAGQEGVTASVPTEDDYFNVQVDSVSSIFAARRILMDNEYLECAFWISTAPPCFPRFEEASESYDIISTGSVMILREVHLAPR
jgi:hypothetical protein